MPHEVEPPEWSPATAKPGEMFTIEGRIRATGVLARGLLRADPRGRGYRQRMIMTGLRVALALGAVVAIVAVIVGATF